ncbi:MAG: hypothetical protein AVDCRST_MAG47-2048, partial [uncultured Nocardioidaceae bacterium]
ADRPRSGTGRLRLRLARGGAAGLAAGRPGSRTAGAALPSGSRGSRRRRGRRTGRHGEEATGSSHQSHASHAVGL